MFVVDGLAVQNGEGVFFALLELDLCGDSCVVVARLEGVDAANDMELVRAVVRAQQHSAESSAER